MNGWMLEKVTHQELSYRLQNDTTRNTKFKPANVTTGTAKSTVHRLADAISTTHVVSGEHAPCVLVLARVWARRRHEQKREAAVSQNALGP